MSNTIPVKTCSTCVYWTDRDEFLGFPWDAKPLGMRVCTVAQTKAQIMQDAADHLPLAGTHDDNRYRRQQAATALTAATIYIDDSGEDVAVLVTASDFGCVRHAPATERA